MQHFCLFTFSLCCKKVISLIIYFLLLMQVVVVCYLTSRDVNYLINRSLLFAHYNFSWSMMSADSLRLWLRRENEWRAEAGQVCEQDSTEHRWSAPTGDLVIMCQEVTAELSWRRWESDRPTTLSVEEAAADHPPTTMRQLIHRCHRHGNYWLLLITLLISWLFTDKNLHL